LDRRTAARTGDRDASKCRSWRDGEKTKASQQQEEKLPHE